MINKLVKGFVDLIYGTSRIRRNYELENPDEIVLAADGSKGIVTKNNQDIKLGLDWVTSKRAVILLTDQNIVCGDWIIPLDTIVNAQLIKFNSIFGGGQVLKLETAEGGKYQFGMQLNPEWTYQQKLPLTLEKGKIKYSAFSIILRLIIIGYIIYWIYIRFYSN